MSTVYKSARRPTKLEVFVLKIYFMNYLYVRNIG